MSRRTIAARFLQIARRYPDRPAVVDGSRQLDFAELDRRSAAVASGLRATGLRSGQAVAVGLPRSWQLICVMLGILRAGGTVVPLDAASPRARRRHVVLDSASAVVVLENEAADGADGWLPDGVRPVVVDSLVSGSGDFDEPATPADAALLFYTSGTTGVPKGVEVRDAGVLRLAEPGYIRIVDGARYACLSNPAFDALSFEVWTPLLTGGCCVVLDDETAQTPHLLAEALRRERVDAMFVTTTLFNAMVDAVPGCFAEVGQVLVGGEALNPQIIQRWYRANPDSATRLYNGYGPTECTTFALCHPIPRDFAGDVVPIGRPLAATEAFVVVDGERLAAVDEVGELYLGGDGLAIGYRNLPEETASRFVRPSFLDGVRSYRTGDLVRRTADGLIEYLGRVDRQVKVRGFRIEPGEVERQIASHPSVRQVHVAARRDLAGGPADLVAYLVRDPQLSYVDFERHVADALPLYMRPHRVYLVDTLPRNANGKVDSDALERSDVSPWRPADAGADSHVTPWEYEVLALVRQILDVPGLHLGDRWIAAGGDSLKALRLRFEVRRRWGCELPMAAVLQHDVRGLAAAIELARRTVEPRYPVPAPPARAERAPATSEQQRLWLLQQQDPDSCAYSLVVVFRLRGAVDAGALRASLATLVLRHPAMRTAFESTSDGVDQVVCDPYDPWVAPRADEPGEAFARRLVATPFDLGQPRMLRAGFVPEPDGGVLVLNLHHIAVDGWSLNVLFRDLSAAYRGEGEPRVADAPTPLDFAAWQSAWMAHPAYLDLREALREHYDAVTEVAAPLRPFRQQPRAACQLRVTTLDEAQRAALDRAGADLGLTRYQTMLGLFACSVYGITGRAHPRVASPVANRPVHQFEDSVGMFANTVLTPLALEPGEPLREQLVRLAAAALTVLDGQDVALADVVADHDFRSAGGGPFDFLFVLDNTDFGTLVLPGCSVTPWWLAPAEPKCPLTLTVIERGAGLDLLWEYAEDHFAGWDVAAMAELLSRALDWLATGRDATLTDLVAPHRRSLPQPGRGAFTDQVPSTISSMFADQVRRTPAAPAVATDGRWLTYAELDAYADALAAELHATYPAPAAGQPASVALYLEPSIEHVVAMLALARLNLTIVPLDPEYPAGLLAQIVEQVRPLCVLVAPGEDAAHAAFDALGDTETPRHPVFLRPDAGDGSGTRSWPHAGRPLYTLFTSGSTGTPNGVQVLDTTLSNVLRWESSGGGLPPGAVTQQFSMLSFDVSFQEIFGTLCGGGRLHLIRPAWRQDLPALLEQMETAGIERIFMPFVAAQLLAEHAVHLGRYPSRLRDVVTAGEQLLCTDPIRRWFAGMPGARLHNQYGPTEAHVVSGLCLDGDPAAWPARPAIGRPVDNVVLRVVDGSGEPVPPDCPGELLIGGPLVWPCYLDAPELNRTRFVRIPDAGWFFRSGDVAVFDRDGLLHFLGRNDQQIKLSGHRLELGEVEAALLRHPAVVNAVVVRDGEQLVACLECRDPETTAVTVASLTDHLGHLLPAYVRINRFRRLERLPRTSSGKLDRRRALAAPGTDLLVAGATQVVLSALEVRLTELFEAVIGRSIGPEQRFFEAGATSLGLMRFHLRCTKELGLRVSIADLFEHVTIRALARFAGRSPAAVGELTAGGVTPDEPIAIVGMAVRVPGADDLAAFWDLVLRSERGIEHFPATDGFVGARSQMTGLLAFDPGRFGISRSEARLMDPQQRHALMSCVEVLAHAGIGDPTVRRIGLVASCGENTYFQSMLRDGDPAQIPDEFRMEIHHDKDFLATKVAYHLGLTGPALTVQAACASSLVAVHLAVGMLRQGDADMMLAAGVLVDPLLRDGYRYRPQHISSPDGHCRPFSDDAAGTIGGSGVGVVALKPLSQAQRDRDSIYAVLTGSAINNDGAAKLSYTAPSLSGQRAVIREALRRSGRSASDVGYVEAHGTGTELGDPVEVGALRQAYRPSASSADRIALASVKSQIGHLGAAAGVVGLVRATLAVHHGVIPPNVDFRQLNPKLGPDIAPFYIPTEALPWPPDRPRVAAVSSFGIGGTNAHALLEGATGTERSTVDTVDTSAVLCLSAQSEAALRADANRIADYLSMNPDAYPRVLRHLQAGRPPLRWRVAGVCPDVDRAVALLRCATPVPSPPGDELPAGGHDADDLVRMWLAGATIRWLEGPCPPPWDFPPPAFDLVEYDYRRVPSTSDDRGAGWPLRRPENEWLHQPHWVRRQRADSTLQRSDRLVVVLGTEATIRALPAGFAGAVPVVAGDGFASCGDGGYLVDPADPQALRRLLDHLDVRLAATGRTGIDWLHALALGVGGPVGEDSLSRARLSCVDTPAALIRALDGSPLAGRIRVWWLSYQAQPVDGPVRRPELGLLAGISEVAPQESAVDGRWVDLPSAEPADWAPALATLAASTGPDADLPRRLALRRGYWWQRALLPVHTPPAEPGSSDDAAAVYLILGGTGGIGASIAGWLLARRGGTVILVARRAELPASLQPWRPRITLIDADLAQIAEAELLRRVGEHTDRIDGVVHAAGVGAGALMVNRDAGAMARSMAGKVRGALLVDRLVARYTPAFAVYCSSMSTVFGGVGQLDYAAANGLLDGFAQYRADERESTLRIAINWDAWREVGMARHALASDARHQAQLAVGLDVQEGQRVFGRAITLALPQLLVSTVALSEAPRFYAGPAALPTTAASAVAAAPAPVSAAEQLTDCLCRWLGVDELDPDASLYDLGADSLILLDLVGEVKERFGVGLALSQLSHRVSLTEVLGLLGDATADDRPSTVEVQPSTPDTVPLSVWQDGSGDEVLCLVHPVGGDIQPYRSLVADIDPRLTVCLIADPALNSAGTAEWSLDERAARYHDALARRFPPGRWRWRLGGWSFGAWVALAMAARAEASGAPADALYLLDPPAPDAGAGLGRYDQAELAALFAHELRLVEEPSARDYAESLARCCRTNLESMAGYRPPRLTGTPTRLWLAGRPTPGLPEPIDPDEQARLWRSHLPDPMPWHRVDTTHYGIVQPPLARLIAEAISEPVPDRRRDDSSGMGRGNGG